MTPQRPYAPTPPTGSRRHWLHLTLQSLLSKPPQRQEQDQQEQGQKDCYEKPLWLEEEKEEKKSQYRLVPVAGQIFCRAVCLKSGIQKSAVLGSWVVFCRFQVIKLVLRRCLCTQKHFCATQKALLDASQRSKTVKSENLGPTEPGRSVQTGCQDQKPTAAALLLLVIPQRPRDCVRTSQVKHTRGWQPFLSRVLSCP